MKVTRAQKLAVIRDALVTKQKAHLLEIALRFEGEGERAEVVAARARRLTARIDALIDGVTATWLGEAERVTEEIRSANRKLQEAIRKVRARAGVARTVVRVTSLLDHLTRALGDFLGRA